MHTVAWWATVLRGCEGKLVRERQTEGKRTTQEWERRV